LLEAARMVDVRDTGARLEFGCDRPGAKRGHPDALRLELAPQPFAE
jgi:hypothetical protein